MKVPTGIGTPGSREEVRVTSPPYPSLTLRLSLISFVQVFTVFKPLIKKAIFDKRAARLADVVLPYIDEGENVLDFGCGTLTVAEKIAQGKKVQIQGVDTIDFNLTDLPLSIIRQGQKTAFKDETFDTTYAAFALHHCDHVEAAFEEMLRITKKRVILIEDIYESQLELFWVKLLDYIENRIGSMNMNIPLNFKSQQEWMRLFHAYDIAKIHSQVLNARSMRKHILFVLDLCHGGQGLYGDGSIVRTQTPRRLLVGG